MGFKQQNLGRNWEKLGLNNGSHSQFPLLLAYIPANFGNENLELEKNPGLSQKSPGNNCGSQQEMVGFSVPCQQDACRRHRSAPGHDRSHRDLDIQELDMGFLGDFEGFLRTCLVFFFDF